MTAPGSLARATGSSFSVSGCTLVSRATGLLRLVVTGAVLGPTFFGNLFQTVNGLPNIFVELVVGALFTSLIVPPLVRQLDRNDRPGAVALANALLGQAILAFAVLAVALVAFGPLLLRLFSSQVSSAAVRADQLRVGWPLLALIAPQVVLYGIAGVGVAAQNARGRFALAAAAPAVENIGVIATLLVVGAIYGTSPDLAHIPAGEILLLGAGGTAAVVAHAALQWWGAYRAGMRLVPRLKWVDPEVREVGRLALPSLGLASLTVLRWFALFIVAGGVAGGVVAMQLAVALAALPIALGARPVATVVLPRLSRLAHGREYAQFADEAASSIGLGAFVVVPVAVAYVVLAAPIAHALGFGDLATPRGQHLLVIAVAAMGLAAIGDATMVIASQTSFALRDAVSPFIATVVRAVLGVGGMVVGAALVSGANVLVLIGVSVTAADLVASAVLWFRLRRRLPSHAPGLWPAYARAVGAAAVMATPAWAVSWLVGQLGGGHLSAITALVAGSLAGGLVYLGAQRLMSSPELRLLREAMRAAREPDRADELGPRFGIDAGLPDASEVMT